MLIVHRKTQIAQMNLGVKITNSLLRNLKIVTVTRFEGLFWSLA